MIKNIYQTRKKFTQTQHTDNAQKNGIFLIINNNNNNISSKQTTDNNNVRI